jgi:dTMP kinase
MCGRFRNSTITSSVKGRLFVFEGMDAVGKTSLSQALTQYLNENGESADWFAFPGRRANSLGALVYDIHHNRAAYRLTTIAPLANQILHIAAHVDAIENFILPSLNAGRTVVLDRFWWSTLIYGPKDLPSRSVLAKIVKAEKDVWLGVVPATVFLIKRSKPLEMDLWNTDWEEMQRDYISLASSQSEGLKVSVIENQQTMSDSLDKIISWIKELPKSS